MQKAATLEAQREAVDRALTHSENLERAMQKIDAGVRQQQDNERALGALQEHATALRALHEQVVERSTEISQMQRDTDEQVGATRQELHEVSEDMKKTVARFEFEGRGRRSVSALPICAVCSPLRDPFQDPDRAGAVRRRADHPRADAADQVQGLTATVEQVDQDMERFQTLRRRLEDASRTRWISARVSTGSSSCVPRSRRSRSPARKAHTTVADGLEQTRLAHEDLACTTNRDADVARQRRPFGGRDARTSAAAEPGIIDRRTAGAGAAAGDRGAARCWSSSSAASRIWRRGQGRSRTTGARLQAGMDAEQLRLTERAPRRPSSSATRSRTSPRA